MANCSGFCAFIPMDVETPLRDVLHQIAGRNRKKKEPKVRRVPLKEGDLEELVICFGFWGVGLKQNSTKTESKPSKTGKVRLALFNLTIVLCMKLTLQSDLVPQNSLVSLVLILCIRHAVRSVCNIPALFRLGYL